MPEKYFFENNLLPLFLGTMNNITCLFCSILFLCFASVPISAQTNIDYYLEQAITRNASLQEYNYQQKISGLEIQKIKTQFQKPQWSVTGDLLLAPYFFNNGQVLAVTAAPEAKAFGYDAGVTNGGLYSGMVNVTYPLATKKLSRPLVSEQELIQKGMKQQYQMLEIDLKRKITEDYLNAYLLQHQMDYVLQVKGLLDNQKEFVRKLTDRGLLRVTDLELLTLEIKNQDYLMNMLKIQYRQAIQLLNTDAGIVDTSLVRLDSAALTITDSDQNSLFLGQYHLDSLAAENDQALFESRYLPQVNIFANGGINAIDLNHVYRKVGVSAGIHASWLFRDGGQRTINAQQNEIRQFNAKNQAQFIYQQIQNNRQNYALLLEETQKNINLINQQLEVYQKLFTTYRQEMALGQLSVMDYLNILRTYSDLQQQKAQVDIQLLLIINEINYWNN